MGRNFGDYGEKQLLAESGETQFLDNHRTGKPRALLRGGLAVGSKQGLGHKPRKKTFRCETTPPPTLRYLDRFAFE